jgi:hypothetical protein
MILGVSAGIVLGLFLLGLLAAAILGLIVFRPYSFKDNPAARVMFYLAIILFLLVAEVALSLIVGHPVYFG